MACREQRFSRCARFFSAACHYGHSQLSFSVSWIVPATLRGNLVGTNARTNADASASARRASRDRGILAASARGLMRLLTGRAELFNDLAFDYFLVQRKLRSIAKGFCNFNIRTVIHGATLRASAPPADVDERRSFSRVATGYSRRTRD